MFRQIWSGRQQKADDGHYWSEDLEHLTEENTRFHFLDIWTRNAMIDRLGKLSTMPRIVEVGSASGYLLEDLGAALPNSRLIGLDFFFSGLPVARENCPTASVAQSDACALPLADDSIDVVLSANVLEHVPNDRKAFEEIFRILRPGSRAVIVVPANPGLFDYFDRFAGHQRRYARGEIAERAKAVGFLIREDGYLGSLIYPAFWIIKKRNRATRASLAGASLQEQVAKDMTGTSGSAIGRLACQIERHLLDRGVHLPFGIRELVVLEKPDPSF